MITDVFFDLDHTLWDFDTNSTLAFKKIFNKAHPSININEFISIYLPINTALWKLYQVNKISNEELRYRRLKESFDGLNYAISDAEINQLAIDYIAFLPENNLLFDGAIEILDYLSKKYKLHIITNGFAEVQTKKIVNSNIASYFITVTNSEMSGVKKPNPIIFDHAVKIANTSKEKSIMIGDCIDSDVNGALNYGMDAVFFNPYNAKVESHIKQVSHLLELKKHL